jgi:DNA end-binding protein Ku
MAGRASWKGFLKIGELTCPVGLYAAASTSERIAFHTLNRATGNRVQRAFVDAVTGEPVDREHQVKGYETGKDEHIVLSPDEVAAAVPESNKTLSVTAFLRCDDIDTLYLDRPYFLAPDGAVASETYALIRDGMRGKSAAALATTVLFRRARTLLVRPFEDGLIATTLKFDYEVRAASDVFAEVPDVKIEGEMLKLAEHIIASKRGAFRPEDFDDRYEAALADMVKAKLEGRKIAPRKVATTGKVVDLLDALRRSAGAAGKPAAGGSEGKAAGSKTGAATGSAAKTPAKKPAAAKKRTAAGGADEKPTAEAKAASGKPAARARASGKAAAAPRRKAG